MGGPMAHIDSILLASGSPRRKMLLEAAGWAVQVRSTGADETWPVGAVQDGVIALACRKLACVDPGDALALAADTIVYDDAPLGKPVDAADACATLRRLSGRTHTVWTGVALTYRGRSRSLAVCTEVRMRAMSGADIARYVASGEPFDKAGSYAIQGLGGALVDWVRGSYTNVVGLPLTEVLAAVGAITCA